MDELRALLERHCRSEVTTTPIPRVILARSQVTTDPSPAIYYPLLCVVAQGRKRVFLGKQALEYNASTYLVASCDLPVSGQVLAARRLLVSENADAARIGFAVGYESASQFSREHRRMFGAPPAAIAGACVTFYRFKCESFFALTNRLAGRTSQTPP